jgi:hypothetical protein
VDDLGEYMTLAEFAALDSDAHHAVWRAHAEGRVDAVPSSKPATACARLYNRAEVLELLREMAEARRG